MDLATIHQALLQPQTYASASGPIRYRETHVSRLYFTAHEVFKFKKPVDFGFLDFSTLEKRRFFCAEEVRLNRRFCPDTYLGVVALRRLGRRIRLGGEEGEVLDFAVHMKRLPGDRMLDHLIAAGTPGLEGEIDRLALRIADLHRESPVCTSGDGSASIRTIRENWEENFRQSAPFVGRTLTGEILRICAAHVDEFLRKQDRLLRRRDTGGAVRDGHGDLHAEHVCLTDPIRIYDCIEFNKRFRVADTAADLAFLLMDLDYRGRRDLSARLLERYSAETGDAGELRRLLPFYQVYRAYVRGKVESFLSGDPTTPAGQRAAAAGRARRHFALALGYLCPPALVLTCGMTGVGKSTLARHLAAALGADWLRSDLVRREIHGLGADQASGDSFGRGIYSAEATERTYAALQQRARAALSAGRPVLVDASFARRGDREAFRRVAAGTGMPCHTLHVQCARAVAFERLARRQAAGDDPSEGGPEVYTRQEETFEHPTADEPVIEVDSGEEVDYNTLRVLTAMIRPNGMRA